MKRRSSRRSLGSDGAQPCLAQALVVLVEDRPGRKGTCLGAHESLAPASHMAAAPSPLLGGILASPHWASQPRSTGEVAGKAQLMGNPSWKRPC